MRGNESQEINFTLTSMAAFWLFPQTGVLISGPCCWKKTVSVTNLSQNVEITSRKWFSDNSEQATLFFCCKSSLWKARRPVLTTPQHTLASWTAGEIKAGGVLSVPDVAGQPAPTEGPAGCCTDTILWAARSQWAWVLRLVQTTQGLDSVGISGGSTQPGGFLQNALLLKEGTVYAPSSMLRDGPAWMK